jgi:hypothetical protein
LSTIILFALVIKLTITRLDGGFQEGGIKEGGIRDGEIGEGEIVEGGCQETFILFKPNLINMNVQSATGSCSVELYKLWYTLADFLPNWNFRGVFSLY